MSIHGAIEVWLLINVADFLYMINLPQSVFKVVTLTTNVKLELEIRLHAYQICVNTQSGTEVIFTLIWLAHAFGTRLLCM